MRDIREIIELLRHAPHTREIDGVELLYIDAEKAYNAIALLEEFEKLDPIMQEWMKATKELRLEVDQLKARMGEFKALTSTDV